MRKSSSGRRASPPAKAFRVFRNPDSERQRAYEPLSRLAVLVRLPPAAKGNIQVTPYYRCGTLPLSVSACLSGHAPNYGNRVPIYHALFDYHQCLPGVRAQSARLLLGRLFHGCRLAVPKVHKSARRGPI